MNRIIIFYLILSINFATEPLPQKKIKVPANHPRSEWLSPTGVQPMNPSDMPSMINKQSTKRDNGLVRIHPPNSPRDHELRDRDCPEDIFECWDLSYMNEADSYYYLGSGGGNDTFAVVFRPSFPCIVQEVYMQWFSAGTVTAFGADYGSAGEISPDGDCYDIPNGSTNLSPIGALRTVPTENYISGYISDWSAGALLDIGGTFQVGDETNFSNVPAFVIGLVKHGDDPKPLAMNNEVTDRTETFTWFGGPWNADDPGLWGAYNPIIELMMLVRVTYPDDFDFPPTCTTEQLSNTYAQSGIRTLNAYCFDDLDEDGIGISPDDDITIYFQLNGVTYDSTSIAEAIPIDVDESGNGTWQFELNYSASPGDMITYFGQSYYGNSFPYPFALKDFFIKAPINPDADLLLINDGASDYYFGGYENASALDGYVYEYWNTNQNHGIDASVINHGWSNIIVYGWGTSSVPIIASEDDHGYDNFIANGGNLMLIDQDWFYGHGFDSYPIELIFGPGDPAHDWFGISGGLNDPRGSCINEYFCSFGDSTLVPLIPELPDLALRHSIYTTTNWADFLYLGSGEPVYEGVQSGNVVGVRHNFGESKTAYFAFMADASADSLEDGTVFYTQEFYNFMSYFLDWLEIDSPPQVEIISGPEGNIYNQSAQEVQASVLDNQNDPFTVALEYSVDDTEWISIDMVEIQSTIFSGWIPGQNTGHHIQYRAAATDNDGTFRTPAQWYNVYSPTSDVLFVLNNEMDSGDYPGMYYFYDTYDTSDLWLWPDFWTGGVTADLLELYNIVFEITSTGTWGDFTDHYDIVQDWLTEGNKRYFLAGDEAFGLINGTWADEEFAPGTFFNDMGISHSYNDLAGGGISELNAVEGDLISGDLYDGILALDDGSVLMYDPGYEIGLTNWLDGFEPTDDATPFLFDNTSGYAVGVHKQWSNGNRTVICGFDPLSLNSTPTYVWWGAHESGITKNSLDWFFQGDCSTGDLNDDGHVNVGDVVLAVACILGTIEDGACGCDFNFTEPFDVLDIVILVAWILE